MSDFTKTISNSMNLFGGSPSSLWSSWNWNAFKWGEGTSDLPVDVVHLISESLTPDSAITSLEITFMLSNSLSIDSSNASEYLTDGSGYNYVFPSNVTNHENQAIASYTVGSPAGSSWSPSGSGSTTWS
jgi:hypothetical protein